MTAGGITHKPFLATLWTCGGYVQACNSNNILQLNIFTSFKNTAEIPAFKNKIENTTDLNDHRLINTLYKCYKVVDYHFISQNYKVARQIDSKFVF